MPIKKGANTIDFLTAGDAYDLRKRCSVNQLKTVYGMIEDVERKIHVSASCGGYDLVYTVPIYNVDLPLYDQATMRDDLVRHFKRHGFFVLPINQHGAPKTSFYISWVSSSAATKTKPYPVPKKSKPRPSAR